MTDPDHVGHRRKRDHVAPTSYQQGPRARDSTIDVSNLHVNHARFAAGPPVRTLVATRFDAKILGPVINRGRTGWSAIFG